MKPKILIFDINETLLDLSSLKKGVNLALKNEMGFDLWFPKLLHYSVVESITDNYCNFSRIAAATFKMVAKKFEKELSDLEIKEILSIISFLPAYPDVKPGLEQLKNSGYKLIAYSNGKPDVLKAQLKYAQIDSFFDGIHSVEETGNYKPSPNSYRYILDIYKISPENALMVAAHSWDIMGAQRSGLQSCYVERPGKSFYELAEKPTYTIGKITELLRNIQV